jgi:membrane protein
VSGRVATVVKRTLIAFYDDQMTHHAAALTYYSLMSLFPALLIGLSLLGLIGQYPETYDSIIEYLREVTPDSTLGTIDAALREALQNKSQAATALIVSVALAFYGTTGVLEAARRALNVAFDVEGGRSFLQRKAVDIGSSIVLGLLVLATLILMFVGGNLADDLLGAVGLGDTASDAWRILRWPTAFALALLAFSWVYYVTPDVEPRSFRWVTPGALTGVLLWIAASLAFSAYVSNFGGISATYGSFAAAIVLIVWLWLTNVAMLFGAELNAEVERAKQVEEGTPLEETLDLRERG